MISSFVLAALLSIAPAGGSAEPPAPSVERPDVSYAEAIKAVEAATNAANEDPQGATAQLGEALGVLHHFAPELASDPKGQRIRITGQLAYARALAVTDKQALADQAMDEAIRTARGGPLPVSQFGPSLTRLYEQRVEALSAESTGGVAIQCDVPCTIYVNERPVSQDELAAGLAPGPYRIWIEPKPGKDGPSQRHLVDVEYGSPSEIHYPPATAAGGEDDNGGDEPLPPAETPKRIMPRWAEITMLVGGVAAIGVGAGLLAVDGKCPGGLDPVEAQCTDVLGTGTAGIITMAAGGALMLTGVITLSVDEVRVNKQKGTQATLAWTLRF